MSRTLTISDMGLKLIKAFEGYRPVDRELITGQRIVGYGHRLYSEDAVIMDKAEAEAVLRDDLEPFEDMINSEVHAPISQSQFDALCSFAFNIGPKAFLESDTLRALNNGRPLDAANGLDIWRKSEIAGKTYVVDALMRRRAAEKALFLRIQGPLSSGREDLPPVQDTTIVGLSTEDALPVFTADDANGMVAVAPFDVEKMPSRRREDGLAGALQLSELDIVEDDEADTSEIPWESHEALVDSEGLETDESLSSKLSDETNEFGQEDEVDSDLIEQEDLKPSPIAAAATDIVARLDALIEDADERFENRDAEWPENLITSEEGVVAEENYDDVQTSNETADVIDLYTDDKTEDVGIDADLKPTKTSTKPITVIDELSQDDAYRMRTDSAAKYIQSSEPETVPTFERKESGMGLWIPVLLGFLLVGPAAAIMMRGSRALLGEWGPIITFIGFVIGVGLILSGIYAALRMNLRSEP